MNIIKQQIEQEAAQLALQLYNLELDRKRLKKRLQELSVAQNTINNIEQKQAEDKAAEEKKQKADKDENPEKSS